MYRIMFLLLPLFFLVRCQTSPGEKKQSSVPESENTGAEIRYDQTVPLLDRQGLIDLIEQNSGRILVINLWATWCVPCKEEFPDLIQLADEYPESQVRVIGISVDYPDEVESRIKPFLAQQGVNFTNYVQNFKHQEDLINLLNTDWHGAVPATFIYNTNGHQKAFMLGKQNFADFKTAIDKVRQQ